MSEERKQEYCGKKLGQPGPQGMHVCGKPVEYLTAEQAQVEAAAGDTGGPDQYTHHYSGHRHVDRRLDADHWPVPKSWLS